MDGIEERLVALRLEACFRRQRNTIKFIEIIAFIIIKSGSESTVSAQVLGRLKAHSRV